MKNETKLKPSEQTPKASTKKARPGRPTKDPGEQATNTLSVRLTPKQRAFVDEAAAKRGENPSAFARNAVLAVAGDVHHSEINRELLEALAPEIAQRVVDPELIVTTVEYDRPPFNDTYPQEARVMRHSELELLNTEVNDPDRGQKTVDVDARPLGKKRMEELLKALKTAPTEFAKLLGQHLDAISRAKGRRYKQIEIPGSDSPSADDEGASE